MRPTRRELVPAHSYVPDLRLRRQGGRWLGAYQQALGIRNALFSRAISGSFMAFGRDSVIQLPVTINGPSRIAIGRDVLIGPGSWLFTSGDDALLEIGDGTRMSGLCVLSAVQSVRLG